MSRFLHIDLLLIHCLQTRSFAVLELLLLIIILKLGGWDRKDSQVIRYYDGLAGNLIYADQDEKDISPDTFISLQQTQEGLTHM